MEEEQSPFVNAAMDGVAVPLLEAEVALTLSPLPDLSESQRVRSSFRYFMSAANRTKKLGIINFFVFLAVFEKTAKATV